MVPGRNGQRAIKPAEAGIHRPAPNRRCAARPEVHGDRGPGPFEMLPAHRDVRLVGIEGTGNYGKVSLDSKEGIGGSQYTPFRVTARLPDAGIDPSVGTVGDAYDCETDGGIDRPVDRSPSDDCGQHQIDGAQADSMCPSCQGSPRTKITSRSR